MQKVGKVVFAGGIITVGAGEMELLDLKSFWQIFQVKCR